MTRRSLLTVALAAVLALALVGVAAAATKSKSKTVTVAKGQTRTVIVVYPDALKDPKAKYKCSASVTSGDTSKVKITKGSARGRLRLPGQGRQQLLEVGHRQGEGDDDRA